MFPSLGIFRRSRRHFGNKFILLQVSYINQTAEGIRIMRSFFSFESARFDRISPYYLLLDSQGSILSCGKKIRELFPGITGKPFAEFFTIQSPEGTALDITTAPALTGRPVVIVCGSPDRLILHGQIELLADKDKLLFIGFLHDPEPGTEADTGPAPATESFSLLKNKNILLVEDNDLNRLVARNALSRYGVHVTEATNGAEAIEILKKNNFDLILMDLQMPVMDGLKATNIIRQQMRMDTPIIALTAGTFKTEMDISLKAGMNDYITKPFEEGALLGTIVRNLTSGNIAPEITSVMAGSTIEARKNSYNLDYIRKFSRGNSDFVRKMIRLFLEQMPAAVDEIKTALKEGDPEKIRKTAHRIKPTIDNFGIDDLKQDIRSIEAMAKEGLVSPELEFLIDRLADVIARVAGELENEKP